MSGEVSPTQSLRAIPTLHDERPTSVHIQKEQPWHRPLAYMLMQGKSNTECAAQFNVTPQTISNVRGQKWFQSIIAELAAIHGGDSISGLLQNAAFTALETLVDLSQNAESESVRARSAGELLNQYLKNKPAPEPPKSENPQQELEQLKAEADRLREKL